MGRAAFAPDRQEHMQQAELCRTKCSGAVRDRNVRARCTRQSLDGGFHHWRAHRISKKTDSIAARSSVELGVLRKAHGPL